MTLATTPDPLDETATLSPELDELNIQLNMLVKELALLGSTLTLAQFMEPAAPPSELMKTIKQTAANNQRSLQRVLVETIATLSVHADLLRVPLDALMRLDAEEAQGQVLRVQHIAKLCQGISEQRQERTSKA